MSLSALDPASSVPAYPLFCEPGEEVDAVKSALVGIDGKGLITAMNVTAERLLGCSSKKAVGQHYGCYLYFDHIGTLTGTPKPFPSSCDIVRGCIDAGLALYGFGKLWAGGKGMPFEASVTPIYEGLATNGVLIIIELIDS